MKAVKGYDKEHYRLAAPVVKEFNTIKKAAVYLAARYNESVDYMTCSIMNDTNCDCVYFEDGSVIVLEFAE